VSKLIDASLNFASPPTSVNIKYSTSGVVVHLNPYPTNIIYMELLVRPEILTSYAYGPTFGNAENRLFLYAAQCFKIESMQKVFLCHKLCLNILTATKITLITDGI
jgi:hypothetical protein